MSEFWFQVIPIIGLLILGLSAGTLSERIHLRKLTQREQALSGIAVSNVKRVIRPEEIRGARMVMGEAVMATDYFKSFAARLRNLIGGEVRTFNTLLARARREALLRMLDRAREMGANEVWNVRFETSNVTSAGPRNPAVSVEIFAFGTAVRREGDQVVIAPPVPA